MDQWKTSVEDGLKNFIKASNDRITSLSNPKRSDDLVEDLKNLYKEQISVLQDLDNLILYVSVRIPELKDEDNVGVRVQHNVIKQLKALTDSITGGSAGKDAPSAGGISNAATTNALYDYLTERAKVEEKTEKQCRKEDAAEAPPAALKQVEVLDCVTKEKVTAGYKNLAAVVALATQLIKVNRDKIDRPRRDEHSMMVM